MHGQQNIKKIRNITSKFIFLILPTSYTLIFIILHFASDITSTDDMA